MASPEIRKATYADVPALARALAAAFHDDPVFGLLLPPAMSRRAQRLVRFFEVTLAGSYLGKDATWTTAERSGGAVWAPPGKWKTSAGEILRQTPPMSRVFGTRIPLALRTLSAVEHVHPAEPHWYLATLGTEPSRQGHGVGSALLGPVLERCDDEGVPAYLESSKERNVPYYRRFGFEVTQEIPLPGGDVRVWGMWRDPR